MNRKIIAFTTEGGSREDGNIYYSNFIIVEHPDLNFREPIFGDYRIPDPRKSCGDFGRDIDKFVNEVIQLGYNVITPDSTVITFN